MKKLAILTAVVAAIFGNMACSKSGSDDDQIKAYLTAKGLTAQATSEGVYYVIETEGTGGYPTVSNTVTVKYKGYLLDGSVFDQSTTGYTSILTNLIKGWQIGIPKFKKGGKGKLLIPSAYAYQDGRIMVFDIELVSFQ